MTSRTSGQHTIPHFYLKGFSKAYGGRASKSRKKGREIGTVRLESNTRKLFSTKDATVVKNFYTMTGMDDPYAFESALASLEELAAPVFRKILDGNVWPLESGDREILATFIAAQEVRVPSHRRFLDGMATELARLRLIYMGRGGVARHIQETGGVAPSEKEIDEIFDLVSEESGRTLKVSTNHHIAQIVNLIDKNLKYYVARPWVLFRFDTGSLITSDSPVSLIPHPGHNPNMGTGLASAAGIMFPLSRKAGIFMAYPKNLFGIEGARDRVIAGQFDVLMPRSAADIAKSFNSVTINNSYEWLFHHPEDSHLVPLDLSGLSRLEGTT